MRGKDMVVRSSVLVIDDSEPYARALMQIIRDHGLEAYVAGDPIEASRILRNLTPDLILLDIRMPEMDGLRFLRMLKTHLKGGIVPTIVISGEEAEGFREEALAAGADGYLSKGFTEEEFKTALEPFLTLASDS